jgi:D-glycero-D-manno-heptose 1,7-bisphosphate phosphatase
MFLGYTYRWNETAYRWRETMERAVFIDRDGVINEYRRPVNTIADFYLIKTVPQAIKLLNEAKFKVFVVTNQGGIGLGFMEESHLLEIHHYMKQKIYEKSGGLIDDISYCPHKPKAGCPCRKPNSLLLENLAEKHGISLSDSFMIGDRESDIIAGMRAGTKTIFIGDESENATVCKASLLDAVEWILATVTE